MFRCSDYLPFVAKLLYNLPPSSSCQGHLRHCLLGLKCPKFPPNKTLFSTFRLRIFFQLTPPCKNDPVSAPRPWQMLPTFPHEQPSFQLPKRRVDEPWTLLRWQQVRRRTLPFPEIGPKQSSFKISVNCPLFSQHTLSEW